MNKKTIDTICWYIPFRKLRDAVRDVLSGIENKFILDLHMYNSLEFNKRFTYESKKLDKPSMLILARFCSVGGIEERVYKMLKSYKKYYNVFILSDLKYFDFHKILSDKDLFVYTTDLSSNHTELELFLRKILIYHNIAITELHYGNVFDININNLKLYNSKIIAHLHSSLDTYGNDSEIIIREKDKFNMLVKTREDINISNRNNTYVLKNGIEEINNIYITNKSEKCLIISRLDYDKLNSICNFIEFCLSNNLIIDIAGDGGACEQVKNIIIEKYKGNIEDINFMGYVDTINYLTENNDKYTFIAGVGQVILEATSLGFPALMSDRKENIISFITQDNWNILYNLNYAYLIESNGINKNLLNIDINEVRKNTKYYNITDIMSECLIENISEKYLEAIK